MDAVVLFFGRRVSRGEVKFQLLLIKSTELVGEMLYEAKVALD